MKLNHLMYLKLVLIKELKKNAADSLIEKQMMMMSVLYTLEKILIVTELNFIFNKKILIKVSVL